MSESTLSPEQIATAERELTQQRLDELELAMLGSSLPAVELPLEHRFTPGLYCRTIFMPAGTLLTSKIHNTEHPFVVHSGKASVWIEGVGVEHIAAPFVGVTKPGTRRLLYIHEDCTWSTFHPLVEGESGPEDLPKIEERIIAKRFLPDGSRTFEKYQQKLEAQAVVALPSEPQSEGG